MENRHEKLIAYVQRRERNRKITAVSIILSITAMALIIFR